jgi:hypothetical protein
MTSDFGRPSLTEGGIETQLRRGERTGQIMGGRNRGRFTIIDFLVVFAIFAIACFVMVPAYKSRKPPLQLRCMNHQQELAIAILSYANAQDHFPGYVNRERSADGQTYVKGSWVAFLLPYLGRNDLSEKWRSGKLTPVFVPQFVCPADPAANAGADAAPLGYVVNCGLPGDDDTPATGVFHNHCVAHPVKVSLDYIGQHDGLANTLLLSENLQAGYWTDTAEADVGMVWHREPEPCNRINQCTDVGRRPHDIKYVRPSSHHSGIVLFAFCDGHVEALSDDMDYRLFQQMMAPNDSEAGIADILGRNGSK